jgi:plastocyanin
MAMNLNIDLERPLVGKWLIALVILGLLVFRVGAGTFIVEMRSLKFQPADIVINFGDTVVWTNTESQQHNTVAGTNFVRSGYWASPLFGRGGTFAVTFTNMPPGGYGYYCEPHLAIGMRGTITVAASPIVTIDSPTNGAEFPVGVDVPLLATATDPDGFVTQVEFFAGTNSIGVSSVAPYSVIISNIASGNYLLTARATDNGGLITTSAPVVISVEAPPLVNLVSPTNNAKFPLGSQIELAAEVFGGSGDDTLVEFFAGNAKLAEDNAPPYEFTWTPIDARDYSLVAIATDGLGQRATSAPVVIRVFIRESTRPTITITNAPANFARLANPVVRLAGSARDNIGLDYVEWQLNNDPFQRAAGTNRWFVQLTLLPGLNAVRVRSVDLASNVSFAATRFLTFVTNSVLTVRANGQGSVTPDLNGRLLEIGKVYSLTALPLAGNIFAGWEGATNQRARLNFVMQPELLLTANFIPNPFWRVQGPYAGLVINTNGITPASSGLVKLQIGGLGAFSGKMVLNGNSLPLSGQFRPSGEWQSAILRPGKPPIVVKLQLDLTNETDTVTGSVSDGAWFSELFANRNTFNASGNASARTKSFSLFRADDPAISVANVTANISAAETANIALAMRDSRHFNTAATLARNGDFPFYIPMSAREVMIGWLNFSPPPVTVTGEIGWVRSGTNGFSELLRP